MYAIEYIIIACLLIGFCAGWVVAMIYATHRQNEYFKRINDNRVIKTTFLGE